MPKPLDSKIFRTNQPTQLGVVVCLRLKTKIMHLIPSDLVMWEDDPITEALRR